MSWGLHTGHREVISSVLDSRGRGRGRSATEGNGRGRGRERGGRRERGDEEREIHGHESKETPCREKACQR
jgi:hypothetical protein